MNESLILALENHIARLEQEKAAVQERLLSVRNALVSLSNAAASLVGNQYDCHPPGSEVEWIRTELSKTKEVLNQ